MEWRNGAIRAIRRVWPLLILSLCANAEDPSNLLTDRAAIERVYHDHRTGTKQAFEETLRPEELLRLVQLDQLKERVLKEFCGIKIQGRQIQAEAARIDQQTRAPEMLAELKAALGNDPDRFGRTVIKPLLVDRALREWFENDPQLHLEQRRKLEALRATLLEHRRGKDGVSDQLRALRNAGVGNLAEAEWRLRTKTTERGQSPKESGARSFADLSPELRAVIEAQLRGPGDVSAVIEAPSGFFLFLAKAKDETTLSTACVSMQKRNFDDWLRSQAPPEPPKK